MFNHNGSKGTLSQRLSERIRVRCGNFITEKSWEGIPGFPKELAYLGMNTEERIAELHRMLRDGEITPEEFETEMQQILAEGITASYMLGVGSTELTPPQMKQVEKAVAKQFDYLANFKKTILFGLGAATMITIMGDEQYAERSQRWSAWRSRAISYADSIVPVYWEATNSNENGEPILPLPALPGQGSQCGEHCKCAWRIDWLDKEKGDADCYWVLKPAEHCQTCLERKERWNPLKIRNWIIEMPLSGQSQGLGLYEDALGNTRLMETRRTLRTRIAAGIRLKGGQGSGNFGHFGRPGKVGGSAPGKVSHYISKEEWSTLKVATYDKFHQLDDDQLTRYWVMPDGKIVSDTGKKTTHFHTNIAARMIKEKYPGIKASPYERARANSVIDQVMWEDPEVEDVIYRAGGVKVSLLGGNFVVITLPRWNRNSLEQVQNLIFNEKIVRTSKRRYTIEFLTTPPHGNRTETQSVSLDEFLASDGMFLSTDRWVLTSDEALATTKGGKGSGNFGHAGRPGRIGGSAPGGRISRGISHTYSTAEELRLAVVNSGALKEAQAISQSLAAKTKEMRALRNELDVIHKVIKAKTAKGEDVTAEYAEAGRIEAQERQMFYETLALKRASKKARKIANQEISEIVSPESDGRAIGVQIVEGTEWWTQFSHKEKLLEGVAELGRHISNPDLNFPTVKIVRTEGGRACYIKEDKEIDLPGGGSYDRDVESLWHEMGHHIEFSNPLVRERTRNMLAQRTSTEMAKPMVYKWGKMRYESKMEITKKDKFIDPYMGKIMKSGATEILSVGLELYMRDPIRLASKDPDVFNLVVSVLRGIPEK